MAQTAAEARQQVEEARRGVERELDNFGESARAAVDIPAKVRRNPVKTAGLATGAAFLILGGPRRAAKAAERRFFPKRYYRPPTVLPQDVERAIDKLPAEDQEMVRAHLERDFASYLQKQHPSEPANARQSVWKTYDLLVSIVGAAAARELVKRLFEVPREVQAEPAANAGSETTPAGPESL
jgi:hypothetical protein